MMPQHNTQVACSGPSTKRQRTDDSADVLGAGPPTKISKTSSGPVRYRKAEDEGNRSWNDQDIVELDKALKEMLKNRNTIALCPPEALNRIVTSILCWITQGTNACNSVSLVVIDNTEAIELCQQHTRSILPALNILRITESEVDIPELTRIDKTVIFTTSQALFQLLSRDSLPVAQSSVLIICDDTFLGNNEEYIDNRDNILLLDNGSSLALLGQPRVLVLFPTLRRNLPAGSNVPYLRDTLDATLLLPSDSDRDMIASPCQTGPTELVITYHGQEIIQETLLCKKLRGCDPDSTHLGRFFRDASLVLRDLGPCAADLVWREALGHSGTDIEASVTSDRENYSVLAGASDLVKHWPFKLPNLDMTSRNVNVSHKFIRLVEVLETFQMYGDNFRGIVFVQTAIIARLLVALFHSLIPRLQFLRPVALADHHLSADHNEMESFSRRIASGQYNLLIATKSFEDCCLPEVPVVILFDIFESQVSRAFSRSQAFRQDGRVIYLVEEGNNAHRHALRRTTLDAELLRWSDTVRYGSSCSFPPMPLRENSDAYLSDDENYQDDDCITDYLTGEHMEKHLAITTLFRYAARLGSESSAFENQQLLTYTESEHDGSLEWRCVVRLPGIFTNPVESPLCPSRYLARREACYSACRQLQHLAELDSSIFPYNRNLDVITEDDNAQVQIDPGHEQPHVPLSPDFWNVSVSRPPFPRYLYPWIVSTIAPGHGPDERAPICILTWAPLPDLPHLQLFCFGERVDLRFHRGSPVQLDLDQMEQMHTFTVKFCRILMNKPFDSSTPQDMGYFFLPFRRKWDAPTDTDVEAPSLDVVNNVDWTIVSLVSETWAVPLGDSAHLSEDLEDAVVQDRAVEFTHRCEVTCIRIDMTPLSEVDDKPMGYSLLKYAAFAVDDRFTQGGKTLLEQCHSRSRNFDGLKDPSQPILEVARLAGASNCLNPRISSNNEEVEKTTQLLIPEYTRKLTVPASTLRMGYLLPSIMRRVDEFLLAKQLNAKILHFCVRDDLLMVATASPLAGNDYDYERFELLGDAFLKYLSSIYVFTQNPHGSEGDLHIARQRYISNQQLCHLASRLGLPGYIQVKPFSIRSWIPPGMKLAIPHKKEPVATQADELKSNTAAPPSPISGNFNKCSSANPKPEKLPKSRKKRSKKSTSSSPIANKTVADVAEAIMGAAYITGGRDAALKAAKALTIPFVDIEEWSDFDRSDCVPHSNASRRLETEAVSAIEDIIGHKFRKRHLLALALTHTTFSAVEMKHHQRLEFIGDAVLDFLVVRYLYDKDEHASPGDLSVSKSMMVSNSTLAAICVWSGLHRFIHTTQQLEQTIHNYEKALLAQHAAVLSGASQGSNALVQHWKNLEAPKALSDVIESIIGAALISDAFSQAGVDAIFHKLLLPFYRIHTPLQIVRQPLETSCN